VNKSKLFYRLAWAATGLTLVVIVAGAWVRLTHAGLGCPDWPGCYGMVTWPSSTEHVDRANAEWGHVRLVESGKAFREMFHRYLAGFLGLVILALAFLGWRNRSRPGQPVVLPMLILGLVIFQAALGMWTVTLLLKPAIVTATCSAAWLPLGYCCGFRFPAARERTRPRCRRGLSARR